MGRAFSMLIACAALALTAGCGSSSSSSGAGSASTAAGTTATTTPTTTSGGLKVATRPQFAVPPASEPVQHGTVNIAYRNISIAPDTIRVKVGTTIKWTNFDSVQHNVTSEGGPQKFASRTFGEGQSFAITVTKPGVIHYECTIHPTSMNGSVDVVK
jgi:plastocyanin